MNNYLKRLMAITLLAPTVCLTSGPFDKIDTFGKPFFAARSQGQNLARRLVGEVNELVPCLPCMNGVLSITPEYSQTFNNDAIGRYFSFRTPTAESCGCDNNETIKQDNSNSMRFKGSRVPEATPENTDVLADNFLLQRRFDGQVDLRPEVENIILDINWRMNLEDFSCGLYFEVDVPVVWTRWDMRLRENTGDQPGEIRIDAADPETTNPYLATAPVNNIVNAWKGESMGTLDFISTNEDPPGNLSVPITLEKMKFAKIKGRQKERGIADVHFTLGRNFLCTQEGHLGVNARVIAPVGTKPKGEFVFEPIVGNGHHLGVGAGMSGHVELWQDPCKDHSMNMWVDGMVYHLLKANQTRTFDLRDNGVGSRYLLFKRFNNGTFADTFVPGPNVTTLPADVKINVMGELVVLFNYQWSNLTFDLGYNLWGRSRESITITGTIPEETYGILGGTPIDDSVEGAANRTNSAARINGANYSANGDPESPVFVTTRSLDAKAAEAPSALSNKLFAHLSYTFEGCYYAPFMGFGGEVEFSGSRNNAFNQWGVWMKLGLAYS